MASPTQVAIGAKHTHNTRESIAAPTQVTIGDTHTHRIVQIHTLKNERRKMSERKEMMMEMMVLLHQII